MAKIDNLLRIMNSSYQTRKVVILVWFLQLTKLKKSLIIIKVRILKKTYPKLVSQVSATNAEVMSTLLSTAQTHLRLPSMIELILKHLSLIVLSLKVTHMIKEFTATGSFSSWLYCQHHLLCLLCYRPMLSLPVLITNPFLDYYWHHTLFSYGLC